MGGEVPVAGNGEQVSRWMWKQVESPGSSVGRLEYDRRPINRAETEITTGVLLLFLGKDYFVCVDDLLAFKENPTRDTFEAKTVAERKRSRPLEPRGVQKYTLEHS